MTLKHNNKQKASTVCYIYICDAKDFKHLPIHCLHLLDLKMKRSAFHIKSSFRWICIQLHDDVIQGQTCLYHAVDSYLYKMKYLCLIHLKENAVTC